MRKLLGKLASKLKEWNDPEDEARLIAERLWPHEIHEEPIAKGDWLDWDPVRS